jgi:hypothetical protein
VAPEPTVQSLKTAALGKQDKYIYQLYKGQQSFAVEYCDYPASVAKMDYHTLLGGGRDGLLKSVNGTLEKEHYFKLGGLPALEFRYIDKREAQPLYCRMVSVINKNRVFLVSFQSHDKDARDSEEVNDFFGSFQIRSESGNAKEEGK